MDHKIYNILLSLYVKAFYYDNARSYIELFDATKLVDKNGRGKPRLKTNFPLCSLFTLEDWKKSIEDGPLTFPDIPNHR